MIRKLSNKWYAVYTKPRWEKKVHQRFSEKGWETYCPLNKVEKQWSDRIKIVEEPLFKSYVFLRIPEEMANEVRMINGVVNFVYWLGKPAVIRDGDIQKIRRFLNEFTNIQAQPLELAKESRVLIQGGAFMDKKATIKNIRNNKVEVMIESIGFRLIAYIDKSNVSVL
ncbi:MAG TPA: UpxY family transcription antiterminator [Flavitalea sp.]|nr:UpxY family transcription antiterminator [Flavitalea sp.]